VSGITVAGKVQLGTKLKYGLSSAFCLRICTFFAEILERSLSSEWKRRAFLQNGLSGPRFFSIFGKNSLARASNNRIFCSLRGIAWNIRQQAQPNFYTTAMKPLKIDNVRRNLILGAAGLASLVTAGCALPSKEAWSQVQVRGLIPVLIDANRTQVVSTTPPSVKPNVSSPLPVSRPSEENVVSVQPPVKTQAIVKAPSADAVPGRPGFVFSPHTTPRRMVDVRAFKAGEEVKCPFTSQPFIVPSFIAVASTPVPLAPRPPLELHPAPRVTNAPVVPPPDAGLARLEPVEEIPSPASVVPPVYAAPAPIDPVKPPVKPAPTAVAAESKLAIPYGTRVPGRPGFVYSPHAGKTQLVDVAGTAPGVVVKCPYTNKLFRVPEPISEQIKPEVFPAHPGTPAADTPPASGEKKEAAHPAPASAPAPGALR
jgi:hypothetical protein